MSYVTPTHLFAKGNTIGLKDNNGAVMLEFGCITQREMMTFALALNLREALRDCLDTDCGEITESAKKNAQILLAQIDPPESQAPYHPPYPHED